MNHDVIAEDSYRKTLVQGCETALAEGLAAFRVNYCLHFGVACRGTGKTDRRAEAFRAAEFGLIESVRAAGGRLKERYAEMEQLRLTGVNPLGVLDVIECNLRAVPANSLFTWNLPYPVLWSIVRDEMSVYCVFDLAAFLFLVERAGLKATLSTRKEAEELFALHGRQASPDFGGRAVKISHPTLPGENLLMSGAFGRFINNLHSPLNFLEGMKDHWTENQATSDSEHST